MDDEVIEILKAIENGENPILFKICSNTATDKEIEQWLISKNLDPADREQIIPNLIKSFQNGYNNEQQNITQHVSEFISNQVSNQVISNQVSPKHVPQPQNEQILDRLNNILYELDAIRDEVTSICNVLKLGTK